MRYAENNHIAHLNTGGVLSATEYESIKAATGSRSVTAAYSANAVFAPSAAAYDGHTPHNSNIARDDQQIYDGEQQFHDNSKIRKQGQKRIKTVFPSPTAPIFLKYTNFYSIVHIGT